MTENSDFENERLLRDPLHRVKRNIVIGEKRTTVVLEQLFWSTVEQLAREEGVSASDICAQIDTADDGGENLSSAIRVVCMLACRLQSQHDHAQANDGDELHSPAVMFPSRFHQALSYLNAWQDQQK